MTWQVEHEHEPSQAPVDIVSTARNAETGKQTFHLDVKCLCYSQQVITLVHCKLMLISVLVDKSNIESAGRLATRLVFIDASLLY